ncbi:transcriptional regulator [Streptomyces sp. NRRL F-5053]|uniref:transcriptional regulator n=1 Tax=Streptomyces sp. NRRL F-5053 TaxID=1463854 RepID=UPI000A85166D|nr:transcriptional regulator [Streptomyces sp. NRRL F-5053]
MGDERGRASEDHPFVVAVKPLVDAMGGEMVEPGEAQGDDVVLAWQGEDVVAVRLPHLSDSLDHILAELERRHGVPLAELDRRSKQSVVRILETRGAFSPRPCARGPRARDTARGGTVTGPYAGVRGAPCVLISSRDR